MVDLFLEAAVDNGLQIVVDVPLQAVFDNSLQVVVDVLLQAVILRVVKLKMCK